MYRDCDIRKEITAADIPELYDVAEHRFAMVGLAVLAAYLQAMTENTDALQCAFSSPERAFWAYDSLNRTAANANSENQLRFERKSREIPKSDFFSQAGIR